MIQQETELAARIVQQLKHGTDQLAPATTERLLAARKLALSHYRERPETAWSLAWAGSAFSRFTERHVLGVRYLIPAAALVLGLAGIVYWQSTPSSNDTAQLDLELLTGELPINAYLDRGFESWLNRSSR